MAEAPKLCEALGVGFECEIVGQFDPPAFDEGCVKAVRDAAERLGYSHSDIVSGAGHDACWVNKLVSHRDGHVPLRRRPQPQRGGAHHQGVEYGGGRGVVPRGGGNGGGGGVRCGSRSEVIDPGDQSQRRTPRALRGAGRMIAIRTSRERHEHAPARPMRALSAMSLKRIKSAEVGPVLSLTVPWGEVAGEVEGAAVSRHSQPLLPLRC